MTQPPASTPPMAPIESIPVNLSGAVVQGPDGRSWIAFELSEGLHAHRIVVPVGTAARLPALWKDITDQVLAQLPVQGLVLPPGAGSALLIPR